MTDVPEDFITIMLPEGLPDTLEELDQIATQETQAMIESSQYKGTGANKTLVVIYSLSEV
jgi:hypothetical protein